MPEPTIDEMIYAIRSSNLHWKPVIRDAICKILGQHRNPQGAIGDFLSRVDMRYLSDPGRNDLKTEIYRQFAVDIYEELTSKNNEKGKS